MIKFFRKIRQQMLSENKVTRYLIYAFGEIILVVIGILIALQINNQNDLRKTRNKEIHYLQNIQTDLKISLAELERFIDIRNRQIAAANTILEHFDGKPLEDPEEFNALGVSIYGWERYHQNDNTFQELISSGNLALISNDSIKNTLLDIESMFKKLKSEEDHYRFDSEELLYKPIYKIMDTYPMVNNFEFRASKGQSGKDVKLPPGYYDEFLKSNELKNGFVMTILEFTIMNGQMLKMKSLSENLMKLIEREIGSQN